MFTYMHIVLVYAKSAAGSTFTQGDLLKLLSKAVVETGLKQFMNIWLIMRFKIGLA